ncbi:LAFA_0D13212g1_1 [Lachancea sp. 'fantastica']|nr:LAFA_0D13212g1_1 [Lachancea sp. 'fantastica']
MLSEKRNLVFELVLDPEVIKFTHMQNAASWRPDFMTMMDYTQRERMLGSCEVSKADASQEMQTRFPDSSQYLGIKYYVLKDLDLPHTSKTSQIVSSCETLNRVGLAVTPKSQGAVRPVLTACIGGVFTIPEHRGRKYGGEMIKRLNKYLDGISSPPDAPEFVQDIVTVLYSEVGEFYSKFGYVSRPVPLHTVEALDEILDSYCGGDSVARKDGYNIGFDCGDHLIDLEKQEFVQDLQKAHSKHPDAFVFSVEPSKDIYKWFHERFLFQKKFLDPESQVEYGYALNNGSHVIWHLNYWPDEKALYILKVYTSGETIAERDANLKDLMARTIQEAKKNGVERLQFWNSELGQQDWSKPFMASLQKKEKPSNLYQENPSLSAIRIANVKPEDIVWEHNAKFCWF